MISVATSCKVCRKVSSAPLKDMLCDNCKKADQIIKMKDMKEHMRNNFRCKYFIKVLLGEEEIVGVTLAGWAVRANGGSAKMVSPDTLVIVRKG